MQNFIKLSEQRMRHTIGVARKAYAIAKEMGYDEEFAKKCFMLGYLHDVGYEFSEKNCDHNKESADLISLTGKADPMFINAVYNHGKVNQNKSLEWEILSIADMTIDENGKEISAFDRLEEIRARYGDDSDEYINACDICSELGLISI